MSALAERIKLWNEVEQPKVAARLQKRLDDARRNVEKGESKEGGGCMGWILGNDDKVRRHDCRGTYVVEIGE
jgi:hypothetical protein